MTSQQELSDGTQIRFRDAGHILGSAIVEVTTQNDGKPVRLVFSGDLGRYDALILRDPAPVDQADYLLVESTYGDREHPAGRAVEELASDYQRNGQTRRHARYPVFRRGPHSDSPVPDARYENSRADSRSPDFCGQPDGPARHGCFLPAYRNF